MPLYITYLLLTPKRESLYSIPDDYKLKWIYFKGVLSAFSLPPPLPLKALKNFKQGAIDILYIFALL